MNLIAMIGTVNAISKLSNDETQVSLKVEKPFIDSVNDDIYDYIDVNFTNLFFKKNLKLLEKGKLIGLKGRIKVENQNFKIIVDKLQVF